MLGVGAQVQDFDAAEYLLLQVNEEALSQHACPLLLLLCGPCFQLSNARHEFPFPPLHMQSSC